MSLSQILYLGDFKTRTNAIESVGSWVNFKREIASIISGR